MVWQAIAKFAYDAYTDRKDRKSAEAANAQNLNTEQLFAKNAIQWKVEDAKKAGIHPLYAMGANTNSPSFKVQGHRTRSEVGESFRDMVDKALPSKIQKAQLRNLDADYALKMARASEVAKRTQQLNSRQDEDIVSIQEDNPKPRKELHKKRQSVKTIIGELMPDKSPGYIDANRIPERYGDEAKDFLGLIALWNDYWRDTGRKWQQSNASKSYILEKFIQWRQKR